MLIICDRGAITRQRDLWGVETQGFNVLAAKAVETMCSANGRLILRGRGNNNVKIAKRKND
jgi:hypothetical protein